VCSGMSYSDGGMGAAGLLHRRERQERTALPAAGATEHSHVYAGSMASCLQSLLVVPWHGGFQNNGRKSSTGGLAGSSDVAVSSRTSSYTRHGELWRKFGMEILLPRNSRWQRGVRIGGRLIAGQTLQPVAGSDTSNCN
jgi:hypothetical protein